MIRWTEKTDCLRVEYDHMGDALRSVVYGSATFVLGAICLVAGISSLMHARGQGDSFCSFVSMVVLGALSRSCFIHATQVRAWKGWAEVAIRGGHARWGAGADERMTEMTPVRRFEIEDHGIGRPALVALLPDGTHRAVLGPWIEAERDMIRSLARELNRNLGSPVDPITAGGPDPAPPPGPA